MSLGRQVASATTQLALSNALVRVVSLVTLPYLTRVLPTEAYGIAAMANTFVYLIAVVALAGIDMSYIRAYHAVQAPHGTQVEAFAWRYAFGAGALGAVVGATVWYIASINVVVAPNYIVILVGFGIPLALLNTMTLTRARLGNRYRIMSFANVGAALGVATVSVGIATWWRQDALPLVLALLIGNAIPVLVIGIPRLKLLLAPSGLSRGERSLIFSVGLAGVVTAPMYWVLSSLDRWILGYEEGAASVGIYSVGYSVAIIGLLLNGALQSVWLPEATREYERNPGTAQVVLGQLVERLVVVLGLMWLAVTAAGGDAIRLMLDLKYQSAASVVPLIALGVFFFGVLQLAKAVLILKKKLHQAMWWWIAGAVLCLCLNLVLVPMLGRMGAALTQAASFGFVAIGVVVSAQRCFPVQVRISRVTAVLAGIVTSGVGMSGAWSSSPLLSLLFKLPVGLLCVAVFLGVVTPNIYELVRDLMASTLRGRP